VITEFRFADGEFSVRGSFSAVGPGDRSVCVASLFANREGEPFTDEDGELALSGRVAVTLTYTPGTAAGSAGFTHVLPVDQLHVSSGTHRVTVTTRISGGECGAADATAPALAEAVTESICIVRYPSGWGLCRG